MVENTKSLSRLDTTTIFLKTHCIEGSHVGLRVGGVLTPTATHGVKA
jgi:hypothetical protein